MLKTHRAPTRSAGFSLVELMVALVVGLVVIGAVLALIMSMIRANNETIQATRLTQELRATEAVIAADLKRARGVADPYAAAKQGNAFLTLDASTAGCIVYGYSGGAGGNYRVVRLSGGKVLLGATSIAANATCTLAGQQLTSDQVSIVPNGLSFSISGRQVTITLTGTLAHPGIDGNITRTLTQTVFIRSIGS